MGARTFVIAEAGVNHNGSVDLAHQLIDAASSAGADAIKFQTFRADEVASTEAAQAEYQTRNTGRLQSQRQMLSELQLPLDAYAPLASHAANSEIEFMSTAADLSSLDFLVDRVGLKRVKLGSGEITNGPLLLGSARRGLPLILSTGMSDMAEVALALDVIAFGLLFEDEPEGLESFEGLSSTEAGRQALSSVVTLLHCTTQYPAPFADVNLAAMSTLRDLTGLCVGYSDHTKGVSVPVAAVALGATVIEKHLTLDRDLPGPDHKASIDADEFQVMVARIREVELALGEVTKTVTPSEMANRAIARRSLVTTRRLNRGDLIAASDLTAKRPGTGQSPMLYWDVLGGRAGQAYEPEELLNQDALRLSTDHKSFG